MIQLAGRMSTGTRPMSVLATPTPTIFTATMLQYTPSNGPETVPIARTPSARDDAWAGASRPDRCANNATGITLMAPAYMRMVCASNASTPLTSPRRAITMPSA